MTFGIGHALTSRLGLLDHVQGRFLQEIVVHALGALLFTSALSRLRPGSISQDLALFTHWYELGVDLTLASSSRSVPRFYVEQRLLRLPRHLFALASCLHHVKFIDSSVLPLGFHLAAFFASPWSFLAFRVPLA